MRPRNFAAAHHFDVSTLRRFDVSTFRRFGVSNSRPNRRHTHTPPRPRDYFTPGEACRTFAAPSSSNRERSVQNVPSPA